MSIEQNLDKSLISLYDKISNIDRLSWDNYFTFIALLASKRSSCKRLNVGCIIVKNSRIVTTGYNGFLKGAPHISRIVNGHEQFTVHAEQNAICDAASRGVSRKWNSICNTLSLFKLFKIAYSSGIKDIKYLNDYKNDPQFKNDEK